LIIHFRESFLRDLERIRERNLLDRFQRAVESIEQASGLESVPQLKRLRGERGFYRLRVGDYRIGLSVEGEEVTLVRILHRREIYRYFP
jgi:mRNA interferase RelE/StbE